MSGKHASADSARRPCGVRARRLQRAWRTALPALPALMALISACSDLPVDYWREEVQLADGSRGVIEQRREWGGTSPLGGPGTLIFERCEISGEIGGEPLPAWSMPTWEPLLLERDPDTREWVIVVTSGATSVELPNPGPYIAFRYRQGSWRQQPVPEFAWGMKSNLLVPAHMVTNRGELVTLEQKKLWHSTRMPARRYGTVLRDVRRGDL